VPRLRITWCSLLDRKILSPLHWAELLCPWLAQKHLNNIVSPLRGAKLRSERMRTELSNTRQSHYGKKMWWRKSVTFLLSSILFHFSTLVFSAWLLIHVSGNKDLFFTVRVGMKKEFDDRWRHWRTAPGAFSNASNSITARAIYGECVLNLNATSSPTDRRARCFIRIKMHDFVNIPRDVISSFLPLHC